ncbi:MAG: DEAD/DEAH box helicase [archaeon]
MLKDMMPRLYQQTILATAAQKNTLVVLPTGLGKTLIAVLLAAYRLKQYPNSKILILAPTRPLVDQHLASFKAHLDIPEDQIVLFTGFVKPEKRKEMWKTAKVIISTPQGMENDIITNRTPLEDVSLIVFDEGHRAVGDYAYVFIAKQYHKKSKYSRILSLTASPGSDMETITQVCQNLYIEEIELRTDEDPDVKQYVQEMELDWVKVDLPDSFKSIRKFLLDCYHGKLEEVKKHGYLYGSPSSYSKTSLLALQGGLHAKLAAGERDFEVMKSISLVAEAMKVQHALELIETQGISALMQYFEKLQAESVTSNTKAVKNLVKDLNFRSAVIKTQALVDENIEHPKLKELKKIIAGEFHKNNKIKIIIFAQYRDTGVKIKQVLDDLPLVKSGIFFGQAKKKNTGLSQKEQKAMLDKFRAGEFNCLIATSVAEEGLDIPQVDLVIFYEPIPSAIRTVQRRGRTGRLEKGRVIVLVASDTRDVGYRWSAHHKEKRMYRNIETLKKQFSGYTPIKDESLKDYIKDQSITIYADFREKGSGVIKELVGMGVKVELESLKVGDYILSDKVAVEFKTVRDFVDSIIDKRLLSQLKDLRKYDSPIILIEGQEDIYAQRRVHPNAIRGMLATIAVSYNIPILQTKNFRETAALLAVIAKREQDPNKTEFTMHAGKPMTLKDRQEYIVASLPGIGATLAKPLLKRFKTVRKIMTSSEENLKKVDLIGDVKAKKIRDVLDEEYKDD